MKSKFFFLFSIIVIACVFVFQNFTTKLESPLACTPKYVPPRHPSDLIGAHTARSQARAPEGTAAAMELTPSLHNLWPKTWYKRLAKNKINSAAIDLDAFNMQTNPSTTEAPKAEEWDQYVLAVLVPEDVRKKNDLQGLVDTQTEVLRARRFTAAQRAQAIVTFLKRIDKAASELEISPSNMPTFILSLSQNLKDGDVDKSVDAVAEEVAQVINAARYDCMDHLISGVMVNEKVVGADAVKEMKAVLRLAEHMDNKTSGWMKTHMLIAGGRADFSGFNTAALDTNFYPQLQNHTATFAWSYRFVASPEKVSMEKWMDQSRCDDEEEQRQCDPESPEDWKMFLAKDAGFNDLRGMISAHKKKFSALANVVFIGDEGENLQSLVHTHSQSWVEAKPSYRALSALFVAGDGQSPGSFRGKHFMEFMSDGPAEKLGGQALVRAEPSKDSALEKLQPVEPNQEFWESWPFMP